MNLGQIGGSGSTSMCAGGIFDIGSTVGNTQGIPAWIVGDTFLKNVYSVFQANPPAVGFALLASGLNGGSLQIHFADPLLICIRVTIFRVGRDCLEWLWQRSDEFSQQRCFAEPVPLDVAQLRYILPRRVSHLLGTERAHDVVVYSGPVLYPNDVTSHFLQIRPPSLNIPTSTISIQPTPRLIHALTLSISLTL